MKQLPLFQLLESGLEIVIRNGNPWWRGEPIAELPPFRRWAFEPVYRRLARTRTRGRLEGAPSDRQDDFTEPGGRPVDARWCRPTQVVPAPV